MMNGTTASQKGTVATNNNMEGKPVNNIPAWEMPDFDAILEEYKKKYPGHDDFTCLGDYYDYENHLLAAQHDPGDWAEEIRREERERRNKRRFHSYEEMTTQELYELETEEASEEIVRREHKAYEKELKKQQQEEEEKAKEEEERYNEEEWWYWNYFA